MSTSAQPLRSLRNKSAVLCLLRKFSGPEGTKVNSRGRAALREAHGGTFGMHQTLKGSNGRNGLTLSGSAAPIDIKPWASRRAARPRLFNRILSGWKSSGCGFAALPLCGDIVRSTHTGTATKHIATRRSSR